jgi:hypothetical protein
MSAPNKVLIAIPALDRKLDVELCTSLLAIIAASGGMTVPYFLTGDSNIRHARNKCAHYFMTKTDADTLFFWDSDIIASVQDYAYVMEGEQSDIVIAPYARKQFGALPVDWGMGFCRIDRSVFTRLSDWRTGPDGEECLNRYFMDGELAVDYFFDGAGPNGHWFGEDTGFWNWCALNDIKARLEKRTRLGHIGTYVYRYPDQLPMDGPQPFLMPSEGYTDLAAGVIAEDVDDSNEYQPI